MAGLLGCFCWALGGLCWIISPAIAPCPPAYCPLSCVLSWAHFVPLSRSIVKTWNCVGPAIDPWGTTLGLWAAFHNSSILTVQPIFHLPCSPFKNHVLVQVLEAASSHTAWPPLALRGAGSRGRLQWTTGSGRLASFWHKSRKASFHLPFHPAEQNNCKVKKKFEWGTISGQSDKVREMLTECFPQPGVQHHLCSVFGWVVERVLNRQGPNCQDVH